MLKSSFIQRFARRASRMPGGGGGDKKMTIERIRAADAAYFERQHTHKEGEDTRADLKIFNQRMADINDEIYSKNNPSSSSSSSSSSRFDPATGRKYDRRNPDTRLHQARDLLDIDQHALNRHECFHGEVTMEEIQATLEWRKEKEMEAGYDPAKRSDLDMNYNEKYFADEKSPFSTSGGNHGGGDHGNLPNYTGIPGVRNQDIVHNPNYRAKTSYRNADARGIPMGSNASRNLGRPNMLMTDGNAGMMQGANNSMESNHKVPFLATSEMGKASGSFSGKNPNKRDNLGKPRYPENRRIEFRVRRTINGLLPCYDVFKRGGTQVFTIVRHIEGDVVAMRKALQRICEAPIRQRNGQLEARGLHSWKIKEWLTTLGF